MGRRKSKSEGRTKKQTGDKRALIKTLLRLYLAFGGVLLLFVVAFNFEAVQMAVVVPFTGLVTAASSLVMNIFGAGARVMGNSLMTSDYSINVVDGCNGIYATAILVSGIIAYPSRLKAKAWGIPVGVAAVFVLNLGRVISLFYLGRSYPNIFNEVHVYVWQPIIILWAIFVWHFWSRWAAEKETA
ncbi:MAG: exosortase H [candidate division Zixibacteria bacterium]|nr:exosortase H [candidate division Zixibacteria bacterium]MDH3936051.1 exosortase H [candidate division Zixibacteria bacterium]MDH4034380.1 exosortase H [candidate division Zixibacteria bacterium]